MKLLEWIDDLIKKWDISQEDIFTGAILPTPKELDNIAKLSEIVATVASVEWKPLDIKKLPSWVQYNQGGKNSCVANTKALMDSIKFYFRNALKREVKFSADFIYKHRTPKVAGMIGTNAIDITREIGNVHEVLMPDFATDADVDNTLLDSWLYDEAKIYCTNDTPILPPVKDIDTLVSILNVTQKPIMVWFEFNRQEWTSVPFISAYSPTLRHSVAFIPPKNVGEMTYGIYEGEKAIVIQDSWGLQYGINGKRIIKESFFKARNIFNQYDMRFKFDTSAKTIYKGTIISLQECLRSAGYFPTNISYIESFGPTTKDSLRKWKLANGLPNDSILNDTTKALLYKTFS